MSINYINYTVPLAYLYLSYWLVYKADLTGIDYGQLYDQLDEDQAAEILKCLERGQLVERLTASFNLLGLVEPTELTAESAAGLLALELNLTDAISCAYLNGPKLYWSLAGRTSYTELAADELTSKWVTCLQLAHAVRYGWSVAEYLGSHCRVITPNEVFKTSYQGCSCEQAGCIHQAFIKEVLGHRSKYSFLLSQYDV